MHATVFFTDRFQRAMGQPGCGRVPGCYDNCHLLALGITVSNFLQEPSTRMKISRDVEFNQRHVSEQDMQLSSVKAFYRMAIPFAVKYANLLLNCSVRTGSHRRTAARRGMDRAAPGVLSGARQPRQPGTSAVSSPDHSSCKRTSTSRPAQADFLQPDAAGFLMKPC